MGVIYSIERLGHPLTSQVSFVHTHHDLVSLDEIYLSGRALGRLIKFGPVLIVARVCAHLLNDLVNGAISFVDVCPPCDEALVILVLVGLVVTHGKSDLKFIIL